MRQMMGKHLLGPLGDRPDFWVTTADWAVPQLYKGRRLDAADEHGNPYFEDLEEVVLESPTVAYTEGGVRLTAEEAGWLRDRLVEVLAARSVRERRFYLVELAGVSVVAEWKPYLDANQTTVRFGVPPGIPFQMGFSYAGDWVSGGPSNSPFRQRSEVLEKLCNYEDYVRLKPEMGRILYDATLAQVRPEESQVFAALIAMGRAGRTSLPYLRAAIPHWRSKLAAGHTAGLTAPTYSPGMVGYGTYSTADELRKFEADFRAAMGRDFVDSDALDLAGALALPIPEVMPAPATVLEYECLECGYVTGNPLEIDEGGMGCIRCN